MNRRIFYANVVKGMENIAFCKIILSPSGNHVMIKESLNLKAGYCLLSLENSDTYIYDDELDTYIGPISTPLNLLHTTESNK